ncbi:MAG: hemin uptake protein HemP [Pseudomonadota bacterium]
MTEQKAHNAATQNARTPQRIASEALLPQGKPLHIEHEGELYILRMTRSGKLILTK